MRNVSAQSYAMRPGRVPTLRIADLASDFQRQNSVSPDASAPSARYLQLLKNEAEKAEQAGGGGGGGGVTKTRSDSSVSVASVASGSGGGPRRSLNPLLSVLSSDPPPTAPGMPNPSLAW